MGDKLKCFRFMESWLDDMEDWSQEEKNFAIWKLINYGIYGDNNLDDVPKKEQAWYKNAFRVIDRGAEISAVSAEKGAHGGSKNKEHPRERVEEALINGCEAAQQVADYLEGEGSDPSWIYKVPAWKRREEIWKANGIPVDSKGKPDFSKRILLESQKDSNGKLLESVGIPLENKKDSNGKLLESNGIPMEIVGKDGIKYYF